MPDLEVVNRQRYDLVTYAKWCCHHKKHVKYAETRPIPLDTKPWSQDYETDCSGFVTLMAKWAGIPDPNGMDYDGKGYTGDLLNNLTHIPLDQTWKGDLVVWGRDSGVHVAMLLEGGVRVGDNPDVASHGYQGGPYQLTLEEESSYHPGQPKTFLRIIQNP
jgi:NlpC/P60 family